MTFGSFVQPDESLEGLDDLTDALPIPINSGYRAASEAGLFAGQNRIFDRILEKVNALDLRYEDQCSAKYYFDLVRTLRDFNGQFDRVVEVGVYMGGSSAFLAGCIEPFDFDLDLIDIRANHLRFTYERVRRMYPEAAKRIRLFHGDLPAYVRHVMMREAGRSNIVHHDGSHTFDQVVKDMASLSYVRESLLAVIAQDTHLRGPVRKAIFVDMALYAVFGLDLKYASIGMEYDAQDARTLPNQFEGNYFLPGTPEGIVLPMELNCFRYPHPYQDIDDFLPAAADC